MPNSRLFMALTAVIAIGGTFLVGCNSSPTGRDNVADYRVEGALIQEMNANYAFAAAQFRRNDTIVTNASLRFAGSTMVFFPYYLNTFNHGVDSAYLALVSPASANAGTETYFRLADNTRFVDSVLTQIVDTFSITDNIDPANHQLQGAGQVSLEWTASSFAQGYILAAVKANRAYTGTGYSALAATTGTAGTIPPEAFIDTVTDLPDTGLYNIYVYAFRGSPDSTLAGEFLPVPLPIQLADNIDRTDITGRFGTIAVTLKDTIRVVTAP
ncbi:MAG: hypothetical protein AB1772_06635 [Candidatus Zixiibacteriota bacterium]